MELCRQIHAHGSPHHPVNESGSIGRGRSPLRSATHPQSQFCGVFSYSGESLWRLGGDEESIGGVRSGRLFFAVRMESQFAKVGQFSLLSRIVTSYPPKISPISRKPIGYYRLTQREQKALDHGIICNRSTWGRLGG